jgi:hypothetical protein
VLPGLPQNLLHRWIWEQGDYKLTTEEFKNSLWGQGQYHVANSSHDLQKAGTELSLRGNLQFVRDLIQNCGLGGSGKQSFNGTYYLQEYAETGRTFGNFSFAVKVNVKCKCQKEPSFSYGYEATGSISASDRYDFDAGNRVLGDEWDVLRMRWLRNTGIGKDFNLTTDQYPISEVWDKDTDRGIKIQFP